MSSASLDDFRKLELKTAKVLDVQEISGADKLWRLRVDMGSETKEIVAGIKLHYTRDDLLGRNIVVVNNLAPATIRGIESQGMLLAAKADSKLSILTLDRELPPGTPVS